ncbi:hypothetical protein, partial [Pelomonas aquatica]|uniref:hypothetical protein n=1 Tax=Pelomonas aquatica TaxID=431058 RepID=UPI00361804F1
TDRVPLIEPRLRVQTNGASSQAQSPVPAIAQEFLTELPQSPQNQALIDTFQRTAREAGVTVTSLSLHQTSPRADQLGRLELTVATQGSYAALKQLLSEWLARFPSATVRSQQWRRSEPAGLTNANPGTVEANWVLSVWTRPLGLEARAREAALAASATASTPPSNPGP